MIRYECPRCQAALRAADDRAGERNVCPECDGSHRIPDPAIAAGEHVPRPRASRGEAIVPYRNPLALIAYYCAIFGIVPPVAAYLLVIYRPEMRLAIVLTIVLGLVLSLAALLLGISGLVFAVKRQAGGIVHAALAIALGPIEAVVIILARLSWGQPVIG